MSYERLAYDDAATAHEMYDDCSAAGSALRMPARRTKAEQAAHLAARPAPSILFEDYPREVGKPTIAVTEAARRLGAAFDRD